jgi:hypothetical protein
MMFITVAVRPTYDPIGMGMHFESIFPFAQLGMGISSY